MSVAVESHLKANPAHVSVKSTEYPSIGGFVLVKQHANVEQTKKSIDNLMKAVERAEESFNELAELYPPEAEVEEAPL